MTVSLDRDNRALAELYDRTSELQLDAGKRLVERLAIDEGASVLDVGCGTGRLTRWIAERVGAEGHVVGIDPLAERIALARAGRGAAHFDVGRAEDLRAFADARFDAVCMASVLHWVSDRPKALAEAFRVLRPGGRIGVTTSPRELAGAGTIARALHPLLRRAPYAEHVDRSALGVGTGCTTTELLTLVLATDLQLVELHVTERVSRHESGEAVVDFADASSFGNFLGLVPESLRPSFRADLTAAFDDLRGPEGVFVRGANTLLIAARP